MFEVMWAGRVEQKGWGAACGFIMELVEIGENVLRRRNIGAKFGRAGGRFVRIGGELYAEGSVPLLESTFVNPTFESFDDIVHFNTDVEYVSEPLDNIELNTFSESTPLLETGVGSGVGVISGGAASSVPSSAVGVGIGIGTAVIGTGLAIGLSGGANLPGHKNIGPGNVPDPEGVDEDDLISYRHDISYGAAETQEDIREADEIAIAEFDSDWQDTGNLHSLAGRVGLQIKHTVEGYTGVLYPSSLPTGKQWLENILLHVIHTAIQNLLNVMGNLLIGGAIEQIIFGINGIGLGRDKTYLE